MDDALCPVLDCLVYSSSLSVWCAKLKHIFRREINLSAPLMISGVTCRNTAARISPTFFPLQVLHVLIQITLCILAPTFTFR
jgi:hypothetical protein